MTEVRKTLLIYFTIWCVSVIIAAGATLWFGPGARVPVDFAADGTVTKFRSVAVLWFMPGLLTIMYGFLPLMAWLDARYWRIRAPDAQLSNDAQRSLALYGRTFRNYMIAFGVMAILLQLFGLARAAGVAAPLGFDRETIVRAFNVVAGLLFAYAGNVTPKLPYTPNKAVDAARHYRSNRFAGWVFTIGGAAYSLNGLFTPFEQVGPAAGLLLAAMILLPMLAFVWARIAYRRERRWAEHEGLV